MRGANIQRSTKETQIKLELNIDGKGRSMVDTGCGFLDHMLTLFAKHGRFDLAVKCIGDTNVDYHHTVEDVGIVLGQAFDKALGDRRGVVRYGNFVLPMDEALILCACDLSGRGCLGFKMDIPTQKVGDFDTELVMEFWLAFVRNSNTTVHFQQLAGLNSHHIIEGAFKAAAKAICAATKIDPDFADEIPSTKGVI